MKCLKPQGRERHPVISTLKDSLNKHLCTNRKLGPYPTLY